MYVYNATKLYISFFLQNLHFMIQLFNINKYIIINIFINILLIININKNKINVSRC